MQPDAADAGKPPVGVGADGGTLEHLLFAIVGDTRPANPDDTTGYPTPIVTQIYQDIEKLNPRPPFVVGTGDYQFASTRGSESAPQLDLYLTARDKYSGLFFPAMGNHECTGATDSNCGPGNHSGETNNYNEFMSKLLGPVQKTKPYYSIDVNAAGSSWTSKFVFVAANAWDSGQQSWMQQEMARKTTYTFVIRHESSSANTAPGVTPSDAILAQYPYTLLIVGHSHTYEHPDTKVALFGNGGAPLTGSNDYGYGIVTQRSDGAIVVDAADYYTNGLDSNFHFVLTPEGASTH